MSENDVGSHGRRWIGGGRGRAGTGQAPLRTIYLDRLFDWALDDRWWWIRYSLLVVVVPAVIVVLILLVTL